MGKLHFGRESLRLDDRTLAHLETVFVTKLRRHEPFVFTWSTDVSLGGGRTAKWVHPASNIHFSFGGRSAALNQAWLEALMATANSPGGLHIMDEPNTDA